MHLLESKKTINRIEKIVKKIQKRFDKEDKNDSKWTPGIARAYGLRIDNKVKSLGRSGISSQTTDEKLDAILKMLMGLSSGNLMNLAVSKKGGMLAKAALVKGLITEQEEVPLSLMISHHLLFDQKPMMSFSSFSLLNNLHEKLFDGQFDSKTEQEEALEYLQTIDKTVDGRKVLRSEMTLREGVFCLIQRPITATGTGYLIVKITNDGSKDNDDSLNIAMGPTVEMIELESGKEAKVILNINGPKSFSVGTTVSITPLDVIAVSEDNKRFYLVYGQTSAQRMNRNITNRQKENETDTEDKEEQALKKIMKNAEKALKVKESLQEKYLSKEEIQELIDGIKRKLKGRRDTDARGMLRLTKDIEKTLKADGRLHPNSVITIMRISTSISGNWGRQSKDWDGASPSGKLNTYPPSPTVYASS